MENFTVVPVEFKNEFLWCVYERATDQVIKACYFEDDAHEYIQFLLGGGAFAGFTPSFMMIDFVAPQPKVDVNESFNSQIA